MKKLALAAMLASSLAASAAAQQVTFVNQVLPERFRDNVQIVTEAYAQVLGDANTSRKDVRARGGLENYVIQTSRPVVEREMRTQFPADLPEGKYFFVLDQPKVVARLDREGIGDCALLSAGVGAGAGVLVGFITPASCYDYGCPDKQTTNGVTGGAIVGLGVLTYCLATQTYLNVQYDVSQTGILYRVTE